MASYRYCGAKARSDRKIQLRELKGTYLLTQDLVPSSEYLCPKHNLENSKAQHTQEEVADFLAKSTRVTRSKQLSDQLSQVIKRARPVSAVAELASQPQLGSRLRRSESIPGQQLSTDAGQPHMG